MKKSIYESVKQLSLPLIQSYQTDLTLCDKEAITDNPGVPFIHCTGSTGTCLEFLWSADSEQYPPKGEKIPYLFGTANREQLVKEKRNIINAIIEGNRSDLILYYDGKILKTITMNEYEYIVNQYISNVLNTWEREECVQ